MKVWRTREGSKLQRSTFKDEDSIQRVLYHSSCKGGLRIGSAVVLCQDGALLVTEAVLVCTHIGFMQVNQGKTPRVWLVFCAQPEGEKGCMLPDSLEVAQGAEDAIASQSQASCWNKMGIPFICRNKSKY